MHEIHTSRESRALDAFAAAAQRRRAQREPDNTTRPTRPASPDSAPDGLARWAERKRAEKEPTNEPDDEQRPSAAAALRQLRTQTDPDTARVLNTRGLGGRAVGDDRLDGTIIGIKENN